MVAGLLAGALATAHTGLILVSVFREWTPDPLWLAATVAVTGLGAVADLARGRRLLPSAHRLVPPWVPTRGLGGVFQFGFEIGTGLRTHSPTHLPHVVAAWALLHEATIVAGLAAGLGFGLARAATYLTVTRHEDPSSAQDAVDRLARHVWAFWALTTGALALAVSAS